MKQIAFYKHRLDTNNSFNRKEETRIYFQYVTNVTYIRDSWN